MKIDNYTKAILTVIAIMLSVIAVRQLIYPDTTAKAQAAPAFYFSAAPASSDFYFYDTASGEMRIFGPNGKGKATVKVGD